MRGQMALLAALRMQVLPITADAKLLALPEPGSIR